MQRNLFGGFRLRNDQRTRLGPISLAGRIGFTRLARQRLFQLLLFLFLLFCEITLPLRELIVWFGQFDPLSEFFVSKVRSVLDFRFSRVRAQGASDHLSRV